VLCVCVLMMVMCVDDGDEAELQGQ
jgi:hypothetical protein